VNEHIISVFWSDDDSVTMSCSCAPLTDLWNGREIGIVELAQIANNHLIEQYPIKYVTGMPS
jgi:hypothetical protein